MRAADDQPVVEVLVDLYAVSVEERGDHLGDARKHPQQGREAKQQSFELGEPSVAEEVEVLRVLRQMGTR